MSSPKNYGLSDSLVAKAQEILEMSSNRARDYLRASTSQARELQGKIYTPDATEADKRKYKNRSKYFSKALKRSRSIGEDEDMTAEKNYGLSDELIESARAVLESTAHKSFISTKYVDPDHYKATSEPSQFGGHRPIVKHITSGRVVYSASASYNTPAEAKDHADKYRMQLNHRNPGHDLPSKGTYVKEETLDEARGYKAHALDAAGYKHMGSVNTGQMTETLYKHPDGHKIEIHRGNNSGKYDFYSQKPGASTQYFHKNLDDALKKNGHLVEETLDEGRGRPRKTPLAAGEEEGNEPDQNIIMQMRKVQSLRGAKPVSFRDGTKHTIHMADALKAIRMHSMMRTSIEKGNFENKIAKSHADFKHHIGSTIKAGGSEEEKKAKVTLPGVDRLRAKGKLDEEFRPNQKVKFKHTDGSWKEGRVEDREVYGVVSGQGPTKHNPNDHSTKAWGHMVSYDMDGKGKRGRGFVAKTNIKLHEEEQIDEAKPDFHYQEWPGQKPKKAFNLSKYLENSDKRTKAREKLNDDAKNKKGFFKEEEQIDELSIDTMYRYKNKAGAEYHRLNNYGGPRGTGMNRRHSNRQNGIDLANERIHAGPRTKPGLRLAKLQGKVHPNAKDEDFK